MSIQGEVKNRADHINTCFKGIHGLHESWIHVDDDGSFCREDDVG